MAAVLKTVERLPVPGVRIPPPPQKGMASQRSCGAFLMAGPSKACFRKGQTAKKYRGPEGADAILCFAGLLAQGCRKPRKRRSGIPPPPQKKQRIPPLLLSLGAGALSFRRKCEAPVVQVWKKGWNLRYRKAQEPVLRRRSSPKNLTCAKKCGDLRQQTVSPASMWATSRTGRDGGMTFG